MQLGDHRNGRTSARTFGEIGATYLIIEHVSLGMITSLEGVYSATRASGSEERKGHAVSLSSDVLSIVATVHF